MSADLLRRAAALMRLRADAARSFTGEDRWAFMRLGWNDVQGLTYTVSDTFNVTVAEASAEEPAEHIASWDPAVALRVARWLDRSAETYERLEDDLRGLEGAPTIEQVYGYDFTEALAVAREYLGEDG